VTLTKSIRPTNKRFKIFLILRSFKAFKSICPSTIFGWRVEMWLGLSEEAIISGLVAILLDFQAAKYTFMIAAAILFPSTSSSSSIFLRKLIYSWLFIGHYMLVRNLGVNQFIYDGKKVDVVTLNYQSSFGTTCAAWKRSIEREISAFRAF
jgi:hypothetical protein